MPRLSDQMEEGTVVRWLVEPGGEVKRGQELLEVDTDKATMSYEADADGTLVEILVPEGETAAVGTPIARLATSGEDRAPRDVGSRRPNASPVARRLAKELDVDLRTVTGTGPEGLISKDDVQAAAQSSAALAPRDSTGIAGGGPAREPLTGLQRTIARRMVEAKTAPDFAVEVEVDVTALGALRREVAASGTPTVNDFAVKAAALALRERPRLNARYSDDGFELHEQVNVGIAVAIDDGLLVPVLRDADTKSLSALAAEARGLVERVRAGTITPPELEGATFTVTNLGMLGVSRFLPIIDPPQAAILALGAARTLPRYDMDGMLRPRDVLSLTLVCDHRIVYGADAARFLDRVRELLEDPAGL